MAAAWAFFGLIPNLGLVSGYIKFNGVINLNVWPPVFHRAFLFVHRLQSSETAHSAFQ